MIDVPVPIDVMSGVERVTTRLPRHSLTLRRRRVKKRLSHTPSGMLFPTFHLFRPLFLPGYRHAHVPVLG